MFLPGSKSGKECPRCEKVVELNEEGLKARKWNSLLVSLCTSPVTKQPMNSESPLTFDSIRLGDYFEGVLGFVYDNTGDANKAWIFTLANCMGWSQGCWEKFDINHVPLMTAP